VAASRDIPPEDGLMSGNTFTPDAVAHAGYSGANPRRAPDERRHHNSKIISDEPERKTC
jgi:hypothetical protein